MKIAQIAPLSESVPPKLYGGTERIVSYLTEELVRQGHEVTLFASGDSRTAARLVPCSRRALRLDPTVRDPLPHHVLMLEQVRQRADDFDILHFHSDYLHFPVFRDSADRTLTTLHGRLDLPDLMPFYRTFKDIPLVSISHSQRRPMPPVRWAGTIYHGLPRTLYRAHPEPGQYLAFLGRISPEKQPDHAIEIAKRAGLPLKIAAKVDKVDLEYFKAKIEPLLDHPLIEFIGEIGERDKNTFLGEAMALVFPIGWPEPFGLVMIEAMACGTPVIGYRAGSAPEVLDDSVSGFIVEDIETAVAAIGRLSDLDRRRVRERFETRFSVERMAQDYLTLYRVPLDRAALDRAVLSSVLRDSTRHDQVALDDTVLDAVPLEGGVSDSPALDRVGPLVGQVSSPPQTASGQTCRVSAPTNQRARTERRSAKN